MNIKSFNLVPVILVCSLTTAYAMDNSIKNSSINNNVDVNSTNIINDINKNTNSINTSQNNNLSDIPNINNSNNWPCFQKHPSEADTRLLQLVSLDSQVLDLRIPRFSI